MKLTSRWLADSAMTTYFGLPAFHAYGNGNTRPVSATDKLKTHNINPHSGGNKPQYSQVHSRALLGGTIQVRGAAARQTRKKPIDIVRQPHPPRVPRAKVSNAAPSKPAPITPETFAKAEAREITILPPKFTEKNL